MSLSKISMKLYRAKGKNTIQNKWIPQTSGVYFIWSAYELLYIGYSKNLRRRISQHMSYAFMKEHLINPDEAKKVSIIFTKDEYDAQRLEQQLIKLIPTKWNNDWFCQIDWYDDWRNKKGIFAFNDKERSEALRGQNEG